MPVSSVVATVNPSTASIGLKVLNSAGVETPIVSLSSSYPVLTPSGKTAYTITDWLSQPGSGFAIGWLPVDEPDTRTTRVQEREYDTGSNFYNELYDTAQFPLPVLFSNTANAELRFYYETLPPATYEFSIQGPSATFLQYGQNYKPSAATTCQVRDDNNVVLATFVVNQSVAVANLADGTPGYTVVGSVTTATYGGLKLAVTTAGIPTTTPASFAVCSGARMRRTSSPVAITVTASSTATLNIPAGFVTTSEGPIPAATFNLSSSTPILPPPPTAPQTMKLGFNLAPGGVNNDSVLYANLYYLTDRWNAFDVNGYPTRINAQRDTFNAPILPAVATNFLIAGNSTGNQGVSAIGTPMTPPGLYWLGWNGEANAVSLLASSFTTVTEVFFTSPPARALAFQNFKLYQVTYQSAFTARPLVNIRVQSSTIDPAYPAGVSCVVGVTKIEVYPPDPADVTGQTVWANPPLFHPDLIAKIKDTGSSCIRALDMFSTNEIPYAYPSQAKQVGHGNRVLADSKYWNVLSVKAPTVPYFTSNNNASVQVTLASSVSALGLFEGCVVYLHGCGTATLTSGAAFALDFAQNGFQGLTHIIDDRNIEIGSIYGDRTGMVNTTTGGTMHANIGTCWPFSDGFQLCTDAAQDLWLCVSIAVDTTPGGGADQLAAIFAAGVPAGQKLYVEFSNEVWNGTFHSSTYSAYMSTLISPADHNYYFDFYVKQAKLVFAAFTAAFASAGRPNDLIRIFGSQPAFPSADLFRRAALAGLQFDGCMTNTYYNNYENVQTPSTGDLVILDKMSVPQQFDHYENVAVRGKYPEVNIGTIPPILAQYGYGSAKIYAYEGSSSMVAETSGVRFASSFYNRRASAMKLDPRFFGVTLQFMAGFAAAGLKSFNWLSLVATQPPGPEWTMFDGMAQPIGDGTSPIPALDPYDPRSIGRMPSQAAGAFKYWATLLPPTVVLPIVPLSTSTGPIYHWNLPTADSVVNNATIAPGAYLIGDLKLSDNVYSTECRVAITPTAPGAVAAQILFASLGDIDGVYTINPSTIYLGKDPRSRLPIVSPTSLRLDPGTTYRNVYSVKGRDFAAFRACIYNMSPVPIIASVTYKASTSRTA